MYMIGAIVFVIFGRTSVQPWNTYWIIEEQLENDETDETMPLLSQKSNPPEEPIES